MSDGPHRSPPMQPHWEDVARCAADPACKQVDALLVIAVRQDFKGSPLPQVRNILVGTKQLGSGLMNYK